MPPLRNRILNFLADPANNGSTDRQIANALLGHAEGQQPVNTAARQLVREGLLIRRRRPDGFIGNYLTGDGAIGVAPVAPRIPRAIDERHIPARHKTNSTQIDLQEDQVKEILRGWLEQNGWSTRIAWGHNPGSDIEAVREQDTRWIIEVKGIGSRPQMRVNYFLQALGEILQRMKEDGTKHSIAFPAHQQFINLWNRLPRLAKQRLNLSVLFVREDGSVYESSDMIKIDDLD
jgi:hypothetical protein